MPRSKCRRHCYLIINCIVLFLQPVLNRSPSRNYSGTPNPKLAHWTMLRTNRKKWRNFLIQFIVSLICFSVAVLKGWRPSQDREQEGPH